jgi:hypothetical protein
MGERMGRIDTDIFGAKSRNGAPQAHLKSRTFVKRLGASQRVAFATNGTNFHKSFVQIRAIRGKLRDHLGCTQKAKFCFERKC